MAKKRFLKAGGFLKGVSRVTHSKKRCQAAESEELESEELSIRQAVTDVSRAGRRRSTFISSK